MSMTWPLNKVKRIVLGTDRDTMNITDWEVKITDLTNKTVSNETDKISITEIIESVDDVTGSIGSDSDRGTRIVHLAKDEGAKFAVGDKIKIPTISGDDYREIKAISGDDIVIYKALSDKVKADTDDDGENDNVITLVGNTGDYVFEINPTDLNTNLETGKDYQIMTYSDSARIDTTSNIFHVTDYNWDELGGDIDEVKEKLNLLVNGSVTTARLYT